MSPRGMDSGRLQSPQLDCAVAMADRDRGCGVPDQPDRNVVRPSVTRSRTRLAQRPVSITARSDRRGRATGWPTRLRRSFRPTGWRGGGRCRTTKRRSERSSTGWLFDSVIRVAP